MPSLIGALTAFFALAAGIIGKVDPMTSIGRSALAFLLGWACTQVWYVFFTVRVRDSIPADMTGSATEGQGGGGTATAN